MFPWYLVFLKRSLVFPILLFSSISLHWSLRKAFLSLLAILWNSAFWWCSVAQSCPTLCDPMAASLSVPHHLLKFAQVHVHYINDAIQPSHPLTLFSFCPQSFPASGTFPISRLFTSDDQNTGVSASASVLPMNIQGLFPLRLAGLISCLSRGLSGLFSSTTVGRHQFLGILPSLQPSSHNHNDHWDDHSLDYMDLCWQSNVCAFQHTV